MTAETAEIRQAPCPNCGGSRNCFVRGRYSATRDGTDVPGEVYDCTTGFLLQCAGCSTIFYGEEYFFSEVEHEVRDPETGEMRLEPIVTCKFWPTVEARSRPDWFGEVSAVDAHLKSLMTELYSALDNGLMVLAGIGVRTCFDRVTELVGVDPSLPFARKLEALLTDGRIGITEKDILAALIDAGSAAAHRGWSPSSDDLRTMMDVLEQFIHRTFILRSESEQLRGRVPSRRRN